MIFSFWVKNFVVGIFELAPSLMTPSRVRTEYNVSTILVEIFRVSVSAKVMLIISEFFSSNDDHKIPTGA